MLPAVRIEPGTYVSKSDTLLSELTWYIVLFYLLFCFLFMHHFTTLQANQGFLRKDSVKLGIKGPKFNPH